MTRVWRRQAPRAEPDDRWPFETHCGACGGVISMRPLANGGWAACDLDLITVWDQPRAMVTIITGTGERRSALKDDPLTTPRPLTGYRLHAQTCRP
jgi:hypothetical protein